MIALAPQSTLVAGDTIQLRASAVAERGGELLAALLANQRQVDVERLELNRPPRRHRDVRAARAQREERQMARALPTAHHEHPLPSERARAALGQLLRAVVRRARRIGRLARRRSERRKQL